MHGLRTILGTLAVGLVGIVLSQQAPRKNEFRLMTGLNIGVSQARIDSSSPPAFTTPPWATFTLDLGTSLTHRNTWGLAFTGTLAVNGYQYDLEDINYYVHHRTFRTEFRAWWLFPFSPENGTKLYVGSGLGFSFIGDDELDHASDQFTARSYSILRTAPFISPEIGLNHLTGRQCMDLGLRYVRHLQREPSITTVLTAQGGTTIGSGTNDHFGLVVRYHIGTKPRRPPTLFMPDPGYEARAIDTLTRITTQRDHVTLRLWDNAEYDGDTLYVILNGRAVLSAHELTHKKYTLRVALLPGDNTMLIIAQNEGRIPPNTASCILRYGKGREQLLLRTSYKSSQVVMIRRD